MTATPQTPAPEPQSPVRVLAFRHGQTAQTFVFSSDDAAAFRQHAAEIKRHYAPVGPIEAFLADHVAHGMWRLQRAAAIEEGLFAIDAASDDNPIPGPGFTWLAQQKAFGLLITYENRIRRALDRDKAELAALQASRQAGPPIVPDKYKIDLHPNTRIPTLPVAKKSDFSKHPSPLEQFVRDALKTGTD